jgi:hypothetical protein
VMSCEPPDDPARCPGYRVRVNCLGNGDLSTEFSPSAVAKDQMRNGQRGVPFRILAVVDGVEIVSEPGLQG